MLVAFFDETEHLPLAWRRMYLLPHARVLVRLLQRPYAQLHLPRLWATASRFLNYVTDNAITPPDAAQAREEVLLNLCLAYGYVAELRRMHGVLHDAGVTLLDVDERQWRKIYGAGPAPLAMFEAYCDAEERVLEEHHVLSAARRRWRTRQSGNNAVTVVLLETDLREDMVAGAVLQMEIATRGSNSGGVHINNVLGADADLTRRQLQGACALAAAFVQQRTGYRVEGREVLFQFIDLHAAFSGGSLGLAATVGLACHLSREFNARIRWTLSHDVACIASLDQHGLLEPASWETVRQKLTLSFYSPLRCVVIPEEFVERAIRYEQELQREFPRRGFVVYSAEHFSDCFRPGHVVETTVRNPHDRVQTFVQRHARALVLTIALLVLVVAGGLYYQSFVAFPNLEIVRGITVGSGTSVYNPKDSLPWAFRDGRSVRPPLVPFGDLVVGDGFSRDFSIYNMTPIEKEIHLSIEGPDMGEWCINSGNGSRILRSGVPTRISVVYAPTSVVARKEAALVIRDGPDGEECFRLRLEGAAGRALPGGYVLRLTAGPDYLTWETSSLVLTGGELTVESWVRSLSWTGCFLHNGLDTPLNPDLEHLTICFSNGAPQIFLGSERFTVPLATPMRPNQWHHIALAISVARRTIRFFLDGTPVFERRAAFAMGSRTTPNISIGARADSVRVSAQLDCEIDNFRVWWSELDENTLRRYMHLSLPSTTPGLRATFDMEAGSDVSAFNGSSASRDADLRFRPARVRSTAQIRTEKALPQLISGPRRLPALELPPGTYLQFVRQLLPRESDACFSFWWYTDTWRGTAFVFKNLDHFVSFTSDTVAISYSGCSSDILGSIAPGWHHVAIRVLRSGEKEVFIDGLRRGTLGACRTPGAA